jgi:hypothetical protein
MEVWWESASWTLRFTWVSSLLFVVLMCLQGLAVVLDGVFEILDSATERFSWLILQILLAACMSYGWTFVGLSAFLPWPSWLLGVVSLLAAGVTVFLGFILLRGFKRLQESFDYQEAAQDLVGLEGEVYLPISMFGFGQVKLSYRGVERYYEARSLRGQEIEAFQRVLVTDVERAPTGEPVRLIVEVLRNMPKREKK